MFAGCCCDSSERLRLFLARGCVWCVLLVGVLLQKLSERIYDKMTPASSHHTHTPEQNSMLAPSSGSCRHLSATGS